MTMREFKKYLDKVIENKKAELTLLQNDKLLSKHTKVFQAHLQEQIKEYEDIRKVINL